MWEELQGQAELLNREHQRFAEFFDYAPDPYLVTDVGGNIREVNRAAMELLRAARADIVGRPLSEFLCGEDRVRFLTRVVGMLAGGAHASQTWEARVQAAEGPGVRAEFTVRGIPLRKSAIGGLCWLIRPVD